MQHETNVAADFFLIINEWLTIFFNIFWCCKWWFSMLHMFFLCCECYYLMLRWSDGASDGKARYYNVQYPAQTKESCRNKVTTHKISNNWNNVYDYAAPTLLRESQPLEWKKGNTEDSRWQAACTSSPRQSSWRWNFAHWRSQWVPRKSTYKKSFWSAIVKN